MRCLHLVPEGNAKPPNSRALAEALSEVRAGSRRRDRTLADPALRALLAGVSPPFAKYLTRATVGRLANELRTAANTSPARTERPGQGLKAPMRPGAGAGPPRSRSLGMSTVALLSGLCALVMLGGADRAGVFAAGHDGRGERRDHGGGPRSEAASASKTRPEAKTARAATTACAAATTTARRPGTDYGRLHSAPTRRERDAGATGSSGYATNEARRSVFETEGAAGSGPGEGEARSGNVALETRGHACGNRASGRFGYSPHRRAAADRLGRGFRFRGALRSRPARARPVGSAAQTDSLARPRRTALRPPRGSRRNRDWNYRARASVSQHRRLALEGGSFLLNRRRIPLLVAGTCVLVLASAAAARRTPSPRR